MDKNISLEINKLSFIANKYYDLAIQEKVILPENHLLLTVENLITNCNDIKNFDHLIYFSAHLSSCAIRLVTIEEILDSKRLHRYNEIVGWNDILKIQKRIKCCINIFTHFFLRNMVAHSESARFNMKKKNAKIVYDEMYKIYLTLDYQSILNNLEYVKNEIQKDINKLS